MTLIIALGQRQVDLSVFKAILVYRASYRTAKNTQKNPISKTKKIEIEIKEIE